MTKRKKYSSEFKTTIVELVKSGKKVKEIHDEYTISPSVIHRWIKSYDEHGGVIKAKPLSAEELENKALRKELKDVKMERDILKKAVRIFSVSDK